MTSILNEIESQADVWAATLPIMEEMEGALTHFLALKNFKRIVVCGCGTTYYFAHSTAQFLSLFTPYWAVAYPASEIWLLSGIFPVQDTLLLAVSRSGKTTETLRAVEQFRKDGGSNVLTITCNPDSPLAGLSNLVFAVPDAQEESIIETRSFTSMYLLMMDLVFSLGHRHDLMKQIKQLPQALETLVFQYGALPHHWGNNLAYQKIFFLGSGPLYAIACEAMLKLKMMSLTWTAAFHTLEFRHGPMSLVDKNTLVVGLLSENAIELELDVLRDMHNLGADIALFTPSEVNCPDWTPTWHITLPESLNGWVGGILYLALLQRLAYSRALANGLNPNQPTHLRAVTEL